MKRIALIILSVATFIAGSVSCQKVNDIDKRLTELEQTVSDLKAQILAGAVITTVDKTDDGCTFTLSNGQTYKVTNGKDGSDGEAIIADVKIEENFVVLTLKNGETLRISYQNPLSMAALSIIPDFSDGSVYSYSDDGSFFLRVSVKPEKYIDNLLNNDGLVCKADFRSVITKAIPEDPDFTVVGEITSGSAEEGYMTTYFELTEDELAKLQQSDYVVSLSLEDKDNVYGASTSYVPMSYQRSGQGGDVIPEEALPGMFTVDSNGKQVFFSKGNLYYDGTTFKFEDNQYSYHGYESNCWGLFGWSTSDTFYGMSTHGHPLSYWGDFNDWGTAIDNKGTWTTLSGGSFGEWKYLFDHHKHVWGTCNGVPGRFIAPDDFKGDEVALSEAIKDWENAQKSGIVFLPAAGYRIGVDTSRIGDGGFYWSSSAYFDISAYNVFFSSSVVYTEYHIERYYGYSVRLVTVVPQSAKAVDLGLSVKWAAVNLGASAPEASGDYYAWGATAPNPGGDYSWSKCPYCSDGYGEKFSKYVPMGKMSYWGGSGSPDNKRKLEPGDDAATAKLGGKWRTPTSAEFEELFKSCDTEWTTVNNVNGLKFTSRTNGNSIFLPAAGNRNGNSLNYAGEEGLYMSSSLATDIPDHAESLKLSSAGAHETTVKRNCGLTIRPVMK